MRDLLDRKPASPLGDEFLRLILFPGAAAPLGKDASDSRFHLGGFLIGENLCLNVFELRLEEGLEWLFRIVGAKEFFGAGEAIG